MAKIKKDELAIVKQKTANMEDVIGKFKVTNDEELNTVTDKIKQVKTLKKFIEQEKDKLVEPAKAIITEAKRKYDPYIDKCEQAEKELKDKAKVYMIDKEATRQKQEEKITQKVEKGTLSAEKAIEKLETLPEAMNTVRTDKGSGLRMSKRKVARIVDPNLIPEEYWVIDEIRVRRDALERDKNGLPQIPGVAIEEVTDLASI